MLCSQALFLSSVTLGGKGLSFLSASDSLVWFSQDTGLCSKCVCLVEGVWLCLTLRFSRSLLLIGKGRPC